MTQLKHCFLKISLEGFVKKFMACFMVVLMSSVAALADDEREQDREMCIRDRPGAAAGALRFGLVRY